MSARIVKGSTELGNKIRTRRNELGLTIAEAASKAGVGTKTWSRYEAGESIRLDKVLSICKALNWNTLPGVEDDRPEFDLDQYRHHPAWSQALADTFGEAAAFSFVIGSDILLDNIDQDLESLAQAPRGTHIGELDFSWLDGNLPPQFAMQYDYDFLYYLRSVLIRYRKQAAGKTAFIAHTVAQELVLYMVMEESRFLMETILPYLEPEEDLYGEWDSWPFDLFDDMDVVTCLYSDLYLTKDHCYHFDHWRTPQFYCDQQA